MAFLGKHADAFALGTGCPILAQHHRATVVEHNPQSSIVLLDVLFRLHGDTRSRLSPQRFFPSPQLAGDGVGNNERTP